MLIEVVFSEDEHKMLRHIIDCIIEALSVKDNSGSKDVEDVIVIIDDSVRDCIVDLHVSLYGSL